MARPLKYHRLDRVLENGKVCETVSLGYDVMYGVKKGNDWVTLCKEDTYGMTGWKASGNFRRYSRLFYTSSHVAQRQADRLNRLFGSTEYRVVPIE